MSANRDNWSSSASRRENGSRGMPHLQATDSDSNAWEPLEVPSASAWQALLLKI